MIREKNFTWRPHWNQPSVLPLHTLRQRQSQRAILVFSGSTRVRIPGKMSWDRVHGAHTYQVVLILEGIVQRGDPLTVPIHQHVALLPETGRLWRSGEKARLCPLGKRLQGAAPSRCRLGATAPALQPCSGWRLWADTGSKWTQDLSGRRIWADAGSEWTEAPRPRSLPSRTQGPGAWHLPTRAPTYSWAPTAAAGSLLSSAPAAPPRECRGCWEITSPQGACTHPSIRPFQGQHVRFSQAHTWTWCTACQS